MPSMQKLYSPNASVDDPARKLQCLALEHVFGGLLPALGPNLEQQIAKTQEPLKLDAESEALEKTLQDYKDQLQDMPNEKTPERDALEAKIQEVQSQVTERKNRQRNRSSSDGFHVP